MIKASPRNVSDKLLTEERKKKKNNNNNKKKRSKHNMSHKLCLGAIITVKPVLSGHLQYKEKLVFKDRWPLKRGSMHKKFSMTGQKRVTFQYRWLLNRGDCMGRLDSSARFYNEPCQNHTSFAFEQTFLSAIERCSDYTGCFF